MLNFGIATRTTGQDAQAEQTAADLGRFRNYMEEFKPGKKWQTGPAPMDSEEIRKAFEKQRFYYVFSSPPMPPGADLPELHEEFARKMEEHQKQFISLAVRIDEQGKITPLYNVEDYNPGMMRVTTDDDARICAAAVLSLYGSDRVGLGKRLDDMRDWCVKHAGDWRVWGLKFYFKREGDAAAFRRRWVDRTP